MTGAVETDFSDVCQIAKVDWREKLPTWAQHNVIAVGNFDGVHRGHQSLVTQACDLASANGVAATVITFDPHPLQLLSPERFQPPLTTALRRSLLLHKSGAAAVIVLKTDAELLNLSAEDFFQQLLIERFHAKGIVEGFNFRFGRDRTGSLDTLRGLCDRNDIPFRVVESYEIEGVVVSSSKVRDALTAGDVTGAERLLNCPYQVQGTVVLGAQRGRTIGYPTINLGDVKTLLPADGVYAVLR